jgi:hypothetical protein
MKETTKESDLLSILGGSHKARQVSNLNYLHNNRYVYNYLRKHFQMLRECDEETARRVWSIACVSTMLEQDKFSSANFIEAKLLSMQTERIDFLNISKEKSPWGSVSFSCGALKGLKLPAYIYNIFSQGQKNSSCTRKKIKSIFFDSQLKTYGKVLDCSLRNTSAMSGRVANAMLLDILGEDAKKINIFI